jgi:hypothetical protein
LSSFLSVSWRSESHFVPRDEGVRGYISIGVFTVVSCPVARFDSAQITERDWLHFQAVGDGVGGGEVRQDA